MATIQLTQGKFAEVDDDMVEMLLRFKRIYMPPCRRSNLRHATPFQQRGNSASNSKSGFKGVTHDKQTGRWKAQIMIRGKNMHLGRFESKEDAARSYDAAAREHFGEFANPNFGSNNE